VHLGKDEEAKARVETVGKKKRKSAKAKAKVTTLKRKQAAPRMTKARLKLDKEKYKIVGAKAGEKAALEKENASRLKNVALRVKYEAAKHQRLHAQFMRLKAKNMKKLAVAKLSKELWKKKTIQGKNDIKSATDMYKIMESGPGGKEAKKSLERAKKRHAKARKAWIKATKHVGKVKDKIDENETKWAKKMAYKAVMKTARVGAESMKADKAFTNALSEADKMAKKMVADQSRKELRAATKKAESATANLEHVKFAAKMGKAARKRQLERMKKKKAKKAKVKKERKREKKLAKAAMKGAGKPPKL